MSRPNPLLRLALTTLIFATITMVLFKSYLTSALCGLSLTITSTLATQNGPGLPITQPHHPHAKPGHDRLGAVASESKVCSQIGIDLLARGGNAADALVGTVFCTGVVAMYHSGIGGGGFMLIRGPGDGYEVVDFRETAPGAADRDMYEGNVEGSVRGGLASGVPGEVRGLGYLHDRYGVLPWEVVVRGAVRVAREGWVVGEDLVRYMRAAVQGQRNFLVEDPNWAVDFAPNGTLLGVGDRITRKRYADTLETIAREGPHVFYEGAMAKGMIDAIQASNGTMTMEDLRYYTVTVRPTASIRYRDFNIHSCSAPASGSVLLSILKIIEGYPDIGSASTTNLSTHRLDEAIRFGYGQRTQLGDPDYVDTSYETKMLLPETASTIRSRISDAHTLNTSAYNPSHFAIAPTPGTSHIVTTDASGLSISLTSTINLLFGSQLLIPSSGIILNNEMNDFSLPHTRNEFGFIPSPQNYIAPGKRPMSSITPAIVTHAANNTLYLLTGAAGGSRIITATAQALFNVLDRNMSAVSAIAEPRLHDQLSPNEVVFEEAFSEQTVAFMRDRGHKVGWGGVAGLSSVQAVRVLANGSFEAVGESRQRDSAGLTI